MAYIKKIFTEADVFLSRRHVVAKIAIVMAAALLLMLQTSLHVNSNMLSAGNVVTMAVSLLAILFLARQYSYRCLYSIMASLLLAYVCMAVYLSNADIRIQIMLISLLPLLLYFLNPLWLYNTTSILFLVLLVVIRDSQLYAESFHVDDPGLVLLTYALVWAVLLIAALVHRRSTSSRHNYLFYNEDNGVLNINALLRVLEKGVANALRYEQKMSLVMFELCQTQGGRMSAVSAASELESSLLGCVSVNLRRGDTLAKWNNNCFVIIVPESDAQGSEKLLSKLLQIIQNRSFPGCDTATMNYGVAVLQHQSHIELLDMAEQALQANKRQDV